MFDFPALDVAIGLIFLYVTLALVCSTVNEAISTAVGLRARFLQVGLLNLLSGSARPTNAGMETIREFYAHPLVQGLIRPGRGPEPVAEEETSAESGGAANAEVDPEPDPTSVTKWWRKPPYPSYVPSTTFVAAITDLAAAAEKRLAADPSPEAVALRNRLEEIDDDLERALTAIPNAKLSEALLALHRSAGGKKEDFQLAVERWFDNSMERVSGWYRRRIQLILAVIATLVAVLLNADSLSVGRVLWRDDAVRAAIVQQAEARARAGEAAQDAEIGEIVRQLDLPLGWELSFGNAPTQLPNDVVGWLAKLIGLALTVGAILLGAPFWFDLLGKVSRVRSTGAPPPASDAVRVGEGEQTRVTRARGRAR